MVKHLNSRYNRINDVIHLDGQQINIPPKLLQRHPGGSEILRRSTRLYDATPLINSYHLSEKKCLIVSKGAVDDPNCHSSIFTFNEGDFYSVIKKKVAIWQQQNNLKTLTAPHIYKQIWYIHAFLLLCCLFLGPILWIYDYKVISCGISILIGLLRALMGLREGHAGSHFSVSKDPTHNKFYNAFSFWFAGTTYEMWDIRHVECHHLYVGIDQIDEDPSYPLKRTSTQQKLRWWHRFQHIYMFLTYSWVVLGWNFHDIIELCTKRYEVSWRSYGIIFSIPIIFYGWIPYYHAYIYLLLQIWIESLYLMLGFAVGHETIECAQHVDKYQFTTTINSSPQKVDFGEYQLLTSVNHSSSSYIMNQLHGGLNLQAVHHLFPGIHYSYYPAILPLIVETAKDFNLPYVEYSSWWEAIKAHYYLLKILGSKSKE
jgi:fatty acid desaturase